MEPTTRTERNALRALAEALTENPLRYHATEAQWGPTILRLIADIDRLEARVAWLENQNREWQDYFAAKDVERLEARVAELTELVRTKDIQIDCVKQRRQSQF